MEQIDARTYYEFTIDKIYLKGDSIFPKGNETRWNVLIYPKYNIKKWENVSFPCVESNISYIISIYWEFLHSSINCILMMKYRTWHKSKIGSIYISVYSNKEQWVSGIIIIQY